MRIFSAVTIFKFLVCVISLAEQQLQQADTCNNSFNCRVTDFDAKFPKFFTDPAAIEQAFGPQEKIFAKESQQIYYINSTNPEQRFIICLTPKSGSTRFKMLLYKILHKDQRGIEIAKVTWRGYNPLAWHSEKEIEDYLKDDNIPRFQIVRNPYTRTISMYESKLMVDGPISRQFKGGLKYPREKHMTFEQFVEILNAHYQLPSTNSVGYKHIDKHFQPQNRLCKEHLGMTYNYYMKMEKMSDWFDCFVDKIKIRKEVMHGWPGENNCYFSTPKNPCNGPSHREGVVVNDFGSFRYANTDSEKIRIQNYFKNQTILAMVSKIYAQDFASYGYPQIEKV
eukprot:TRINITY_DN2766_c0_g1_i2.p1 TRINITY_DN2766_c0_g1~~TRINITY_DN2766_c0_g1_i2.p1  ORF type:complete len:338 (+),score=32.84 TRINITY_DN2766_c0_g1_i2:235-1248(+)